MASEPRPVYGPLPSTTRADEPVDCTAALMLLDMDLQGVFASPEGTMSQHFRSLSSQLRLSLMLMLMEAARQSKLDFFLETVYDSYRTQHLPIMSGGFRVYAKSLRLWIPVATLDMLTIFYEKVELLTSPKDEEPKSKRSAKMEEEEEFEEAGCRFLNSEDKVKRAILTTFHGRSDYHCHAIDKSAPVVVGEHEADSLASIFSAEDLFADPVYQRRLYDDETLGYRAPPFQRQLSSYKPTSTTFARPAGLVDFDELFRRYVPSNSCFRVLSDKEPSADAFLNMTLPHIFPTHETLADHMANITYSAGTLPPDFKEMAPDLLNGLFCTDATLAMHNVDRNELVDPIGHSPVPYYEFGADVSMESSDFYLKKIYPEFFKIQTRFKTDMSAIMSKRDEEQFDARQELRRLSEAAINVLAMLSQEQMPGVPTQFPRFYGEWKNTLMPSMLRAEKMNSRACDFWTMNSIMSSSEAGSYHESSLILCHLIDMASCQDGYDLMPAQIGPYVLSINGVHNLAEVAFGAQPGILNVGARATGKSKIINMVMCATPRSMIHQTSGASEKAWTAMTKTPVLHAEDEAVCPDDKNNSHAKRKLTTMSEGVTVYDRFNLNTKGQKRRKMTGAPEIQHSTVEEYQDCRRIEVLATNDSPTQLQSWLSRYLVVRSYAKKSTELKGMRSMTERRSATRSEGVTDVSLVMRLWISYSWIPHHLSAILGMKVGEYMREVFIAIYNRYLGELHGHPSLSARQFDSLTNLASGAMVARLTTKHYRWRKGTTIMNLLDDMRNGGYALQMADMVNTWLQATGASDRLGMLRKALCVIKGLVTFEKGVAGAPEIDDDEQYYFLSCEMKQLAAIMDLRSDLGYGIIGSALYELKNSTHAVSGLAILVETPNTGIAKVLRASVDIPQVTSPSEIALRKLVTTIIKWDSDSQHHAINYAETGYLFTKDVILPYLGNHIGLISGVDEHGNDYGFGISNKMHLYNQGIYWWEQSGLLSKCEHRLGGPNYPVAIRFPSSDIHGDLEDCVEGGRFDHRAEGGELRKKAKTPYYNAYMEVFDTAFQEDVGVGETSDEVKTFLDYCYCAADPNNVGKKVFCAISDTHTETQGCTKFHVVRPITTPLTIVNPGRRAKSMFIATRESNSLFGDHQNYEIDGECNFDQRAREMYARENSV